MQCDANPVPAEVLAVLFEWSYQYKCDQRKKAKTVVVKAAAAAAALAAAITGRRSRNLADRSPCGQIQRPGCGLADERGTARPFTGARDCIDGRWIPLCREK